MSRTEKAVKSVIAIMIITLFSKALGFVREILTASSFGSNMQTDAFFIAITATTLITEFFASAINTTLIPILSDVQKKKGAEGKVRYVNNFLNLTLVLSVVLIFLSWVSAPLLIRAIASGFEGEQYLRTVYLFRLGLPVLIFGNLTGVFAGFLQSEMRFAESASSQLPFNFVYITFLLFFSDQFGINGLMAANVLAVASQVLLYVLALRNTGYRYQFVIDLKDPYIKKNLSLIFPVVLSVAVSDVNKIIDQTMASLLDDGSISALSYSSRLKNIITGLFSAAIVTVLYPNLSNLAGQSSLKEFKNLLQSGIITLVMISIPATVGIIVLSEPIIRFAFERGAFDAHATAMTSSALIFYSLGIVAYSVKQFLNRVYFALHDTVTPMYNVILTIFINVSFNLVLIRFMAHDGLALATSISSLASTLILLLGLRKKIGPLGLKSITYTVGKILAASVIMGVVTLRTHNLIIGMYSGAACVDALSLVVPIGVAVIVYLFLLRIMRVHELLWIIELIRRKLKRSKT